MRDLKRLPRFTLLYILAVKLYCVKNWGFEFYSRQGLKQDSQNGPLKVETMSILKNILIFNLKLNSKGF